MKGDKESAGVHVDAVVVGVVVVGVVVHLSRFSVASLWSLMC